jgi:hypothetical protein
MSENQGIQFPLALLGETILRANAPLVEAIRGLTVATNALLAQTKTGGSTVARSGKERGKSTFNMERVLIARGLFECGDQHCQDCAPEQQVSCCLDYKILSPNQLEDIASDLLEKGRHEKG